MKGTLRTLAGLIAGCVSAVAIAAIGFSVLRVAWPEYAAAEPTKAYTLAMQIARLSIAALCTAGAACVTTLVTGDDGRAAWWLGLLFVVVSLPSHLHSVWDDYPAWYHFVYLGSLIPVAGFSARAFLAATGRRRQHR